MAASTSKKPAKKRASGNPAKSVSTAKGWKRNKGEELELPSGNVALVKRPGPQALLSKGILPDTLMPIVQQAIKSGKGLRPEDTEAMMKDPEKIVEMLDAMDRLLVEVVVEPTVAYHKELIDDEWVDIPADERDEDTFVYTDDIDMDDKMFVFQYAVGGTRDLERFRHEHAAGLGNLPDGSGDENTSE
jgi:hypothetical protein